MFPVKVRYMCIYISQEVIISNPIIMHEDLQHSAALFNYSVPFNKLPIMFD